MATAASALMGDSASFGGLDHDCAGDSPGRAPVPPSGVQRPTAKTSPSPVTNDRTSTNQRMRFPVQLDRASGDGGEGERLEVDDLGKGQTRCGQLKVETEFEELQGEVERTCGEEKEKAGRRADDVVVNLVDRGCQTTDQQPLVQRTDSRRRRVSSCSRYHPSADLSTAGEAYFEAEPSKIGDAADDEEELSSTKDRNARLSDSELGKELRKLLESNKQKTYENESQAIAIEDLKKQIVQLLRKNSRTEIENDEKEIKIAFLEDENKTLEQRLLEIQAVLAKLEDDFRKMTSERTEFKSLYIDSRLKADKSISRLTDEINQQIEAKEAFVHLAQQNTLSRSSASALRKALATTEDYLRLKRERNCLSDRVQHLKTKVEIQDLYIEDLSSGIRELSQIIRHYIPTHSGEEKEPLPQSVSLTEEGGAEGVDEERTEEEEPWSGDLEEEKRKQRLFRELFRLPAPDSHCSRSRWSNGILTTENDLDLDLEKLEMEDLVTCQGDVEFRTPLSSPSSISVPAVSSSFQSVQL